MYPACQSCRKKLIENGEGDYTCYSCDVQHVRHSKGGEEAEIHESEWNAEGGRGDQAGREG